MGCSCIPDKTLPWVKKFSSDLYVYLQCSFCWKKKLEGKSTLNKFHVNIYNKINVWLNSELTFLFLFFFFGHMACITHSAACGPSTFFSFLVSVLSMMWSIITYSFPVYYQDYRCLCCWVQILTLLSFWRNRQSQIHLATAAQDVLRGLVRVHLII